MRSLGERKLQLYDDNADDEDNEQMELDAHFIQKEQHKSHWSACFLGLLWPPF